MAKIANKEQFPWKFMLPLVLGTMLNPLNSTMLATALATLCNSFKITTGQGAVLITSLYITAQPLPSRLWAAWPIFIARAGLTILAFC
jgi:hypothetical protein